MSYDKQVTRSIWEGRVPIVFVLFQGDMASLKKPDDLYTMAYRCMLLPLIANEAIQQFQPFATKGGEGDDIWFESNGIPLKSHYPIGVLFDMYTTNGSLPWVVTVHFRNFPSDKLIRLSGEEALKSHFFNMVKQTETVKCGTTKRIMNMSKMDTDQLWEGYITHNYQKFWTVNAQLAASDPSSTRGVPFRIYLLNDAPLIQKIVSPLNSSGQPETLEGLLRECVPHANPETASKSRLLLHGISPPLNTPLAWLSENMSYPDNFLHFVLLTP